MSSGEVSEMQNDQFESANNSDEDISLPGISDRANEQTIDETASKQQLKLEVMSQRQQINALKQELSFRCSTGKLDLQTPIPLSAMSNSPHSYKEHNQLVEELENATTTITNLETQLNVQKESIVLSFTELILIGGIIGALFLILISIISYICCKDKSNNNNNLDHVHASSSNELNNNKKIHVVAKMQPMMKHHAINREMKDFFKRNKMNANEKLDHVEINVDTTEKLDIGEPEKTTTEEGAPETAQVSNVADDQNLSLALFPNANEVGLSINAKGNDTLNRNR